MINSYRSSRQDNCSMRMLLDTQADKQIWLYVISSYHYFRLLNQDMDCSEANYIIIERKLDFRLFVTRELSLFLYVTSLDFHHSHVTKPALLHQTINVMKILTDPPNLIHWNPGKFLLTVSVKIERHWRTILYLRSAIEYLESLKKQQNYSC